MHLLCGPLSLSSKIACVVFELNLLADVETEPREAQAADASFVLNSATHHVYKRAHADVVLAWLAQEGVPVGIWTHEPRRLTRATLRRAFPTLRCALVRTRRSCTVHDNVYVKDPRKLRGRCLLVDFNATQVAYNLEEGIATPTLVDAEGDLRKVRLLRCACTESVAARSRLRGSGVGAGFLSGATRCTPSRSDAGSMPCTRWWPNFARS